MANFQVGEGIRSAMAKYGEDPLEDEFYIGDRESHCASDKALYIYSKEVNLVYRCPLA